MSGLGPQHLTELLREFDESGWETMAVATEGLSLTVSRTGRPDAPAPAPDQGARPPDRLAEAPAKRAPSAPAEQPAAVLEEGLAEVKSPVLGMFYVAPKPGAKPFVEVGNTVAADDTVAIVEVMKLMNQIDAGVAGEIVEVCATNGAMVEFDEVLFRIRPEAT